MASQPEPWNIQKSWERKIIREWEIDRLLMNLEIITQQRYRDNTRKDLLLGLLCGYGLKKISNDLVRDYAVVRGAVSSIYRDIEALTGEANKSVRSGNLAYILEKYGYRQNSSPGNSIISPILNNLPAPTYREFVGRDAEMKLLLERLAPNHAAHIITLDGIGGVGKTALVLQAAYLCLNGNGDAPRFNAIIFTSAKQQELIHSILRRQQGQRNLRDIFREIAYTLDELGILQSPPDDQFSMVRQVLSRQRTLLIVDNMETIEDTEKVISFLYDLPTHVKIILTTRERIALLPISLKHLSPNDGLQLIQQQAIEKGLNFSEENSKLLYQRTGGIPLAIVYAIAQVSDGYPLQFVLERLALATGDMARFCFEQSVQTMKQKPPHKLLMSLAIFPEPPIPSSVGEIAGLTTSPDLINDGLARLQKLSLVNLNQETGRYEMLSLTREYALAELAAYPEFEREARQRWVQWYLDFARSYAGEDWEQWVDYDKLKEEEGNLRNVLYWCKDQNRYEAVRDLWLLLSHYANLYAYWDDRLDWLQWLIEQSERRGEWSYFVRFMIRKSWLLIRLCSQESLNEAEEILRRVWILRQHVSDQIQADLAESMARLKIKQEDIREASDWLKIEEELVISSHLEPRKHIRYIIPVLYHQAEILYLQGDYQNAQIFFEQVMESAEEISWHRVINSAQNWLADIAIDLDGRDKAEQLLIKGLTVAETSKNQRRLARYQRSLARWEKKWGNPEKARDFANQAINSFRLLGMTRDVETVKKLLDV
jgi:alkylated DNA nucleotide flippase Atl1